MPELPAGFGLIMALPPFWHTLSPLGLGLGLSGAALLAVAVLGLVALPGWLTRPAIVAGGLLLAAGAVDQLGYARAAHQAELRRTEEIAAANLRRAEAAEDALAADRRQAAADAATLAPLQEAVRTTPANPAPALPRASARRLGGIR